MKTNKGYLSLLINCLCGIILIVTITGCSSQPAMSPNDFIKLFIKKHISKIDLSLADFYVKEERAGIRKLVNKTIQAKQRDGSLEALKKATYDFSKLHIDVIAEKEDYVDDQPVSLVEIKTSGFYTKSVEGKEEKVVEDEVFVLESVGDEWKVTNKIKPWK